jgi:hypothetical protein
MMAEAHIIRYPNYRCKLVSCYPVDTATQSLHMDHDFLIEQTDDV